MKHYENLPSHRAKGSTIYLVQTKSRQLVQTHGRMPDKHTNMKGWGEGVQGVVTGRGILHTSSANNIAVIFSHVFWEWRSVSFLFTANALKPHEATEDQADRAREFGPLGGQPAEVLKHGHSSMELRILWCSDCTRHVVDLFAKQACQWTSTMH